MIKTSDLVTFLILWAAIMLVIFFTLDSQAGPRKTVTIRTAIIDTGFNIAAVPKGMRVPLCKYGHYDFRDSKPRVGMDYIGHGTEMARLITEEVDKNLRYKMCLIIINIHSPFGFKAEVVSKAIYKAIKAKARVINISLEGSYYSNREEIAIYRALKKGVKLFIAAGNRQINLNHKCYTYPACYKYPPVLSRRITIVGALDKFGNKASYSNYGSFLIWTPGFTEGGKSNGTSISSARAAGKYVNWLLGGR